jgi:hypothetical protein
MIVNWLQAFPEFNLLKFHRELNFDLLLSFPGIRILQHFLRIYYVLPL